MVVNNIKVKIGIIILLFLFLLCGCAKTKNNTELNIKNITITIINNDETELLNKNVLTDEKYLIDVLKKDEEFKLEYEDSKYGAYIISLMGIEQKNDNDGTYYWAYYVNDEYASTGVSNCEIKDGANYKFVYEFYNYKE